VYEPLQSLRPDDSDNAPHCVEVNRIKRSWQCYNIHYYYYEDPCWSTVLKEMPLISLMTVCVSGTDATV